MDWMYAVTAFLGFLSQYCDRNLHQASLKENIIMRNFIKFRAGLKPLARGVSRMKYIKVLTEIKKNTAVLINPELIIVCKHCGKPIEEALLTGFSLICSLCGKPQDGLPHPKTKEDPE